MATLSLELTSMITDPNSLSMRQIKAVFKRHHGTASTLARELGVAPQNVYDFLKGVGRSRRVADAVRARAAELLDAEKAARREG